MDWLFQPLIFSCLFAFILGKECLIEECGNKYHMAMEQAGLIDAQASPTYCDILRAYQKCMKNTGQACRGNLNYHGSHFVTEKGIETYCSHKAIGAGAGKGSKGENVHDPSTRTSSSSPLPSCRYYGSQKFKHCGFFGDPHLKTFVGKYQTCRVHGTWNLIDNPYMLVQVTNKPVVEDSFATAPTKIVVVVKSRSTPCTLEKRYEADSAYPLPSTFVDGTDRPGADETVSVRWRQDEKENRETVEIYMKYIATRLVIRRVGKYLAFSARLPEEVVRESVSYNENEGKLELCTAGCPASEQLDIEAAREYILSREQALSECKNTEKLSYEIRNNLTDNYLDWCVFDLMTAGLAYDFVAVAHSAQSDAFNMDPTSLKNRTELLDQKSAGDGSQGSGGAGTLCALQQLPFYVSSFVAYLLSRCILL